MSNQTFYWEGAVPPAEEVEIVNRLWAPLTPDSQRKDALLHMLSSNSTVVRGMGLDYYSLSNGSGRQGQQPMCDDPAIDTAARACALRELSEPPYGGEAASKMRGANHASALHALWFNARPEDASLVAAVLLADPDDRVLGPGVGAAEPILRGEPAHRRLVEALLRVVSRGDLAPRLRGEAIAAIGGASDESVEPLLVELLARPELAVSAAAGRKLLERDLERYRSLVSSVVAGWHPGELPPFDVHEVHRLLDGEDD